VLFLVGPFVVAASGSLILGMMWRGDEVLRSETGLVWNTLRRRLAVVLLSVATVLAMALCLLSTTHVLTE
jgi:K+-transporting ATPase A subunit